MATSNSMYSASTLLSSAEEQDSETPGSEQEGGPAASSSRGRPKLEVDRERLQYLRSLHFTWGQIASLSGISTKTVQRRAKEYGITKYSDVSDPTLDNVIRSILHANPAAGEVMIIGHLHSLEVD